MNLFTVADTEVLFFFFTNKNKCFDPVGEQAEVRCALGGALQGEDQSQLHV